MAKNRSNLLTGNTFLGVRPGTITKKTIREKARKDKEAAAKRAPVVNKALQDKNTLMTQAKKKYELRPVGSDARIVRSLQNVINSKPTQNLGPAVEKAGAYSYSFKGASQYAINKDFLKNYTQATMPQNMIELAKNDAIRDTTSDRDSFDYTNKRGSDPEAQREIIEWGQKIMFDEEAIEDWVLAGVTYQEKCRRAQYVEDWFSNPNNIRSSWTVNPGQGGLYTVPMITDKAKLPEWVKPTSDNQNYWDYYKTYSTSVNKANVDAYKRMKDAEWERKVKPYSSAFSSDGYENDVNSFADILIKSNTTEQLRANTAQYFKDYLINPVIHGHRLTAVGNMLWNFMESADIAARGVRAFVAGDVVLGGSGGTWSKDEYDFGGGTYADYMRGSAYGIKHTSGRNPDAKFKGQQVYWIKLRGHSDEEAKKAQLLFMDNGGYELLMRDFPVLATKAGLTSKYASMSREELEDELRLKFANSDISWQDVYRTIANEYVPSRAQNDLQQAVTNVKAAYSDINADFSAQTGSLLGDIVVESVLDPGLVAGGISKGAVKSGVRSAAENAISEGFRAIGRDSDNMAKLLNDKRFISAVNEFVNHNEGKNIIFKNNKEFLADITHFMDRTHKEFGLFDNLTDRNAFRRVVYGQLMDKQISVAGKIIEPQVFARKALDSKAFKSMYYLDKSIDLIDSAIAKSSFLVPWGAVKAAKLGIPAVMDTKVARQIMARRNQKLIEAFRSMVDEATGKVNVTKISDVMDRRAVGVLDEKSVRMALQVTADQYDDIVMDIEGIISQFRKGKITDEQAKRAVSDAVSDITGGAYKDLDSLSAHVNNLNFKGATDIKNAFGRLNDAYKRLDDIVNNNASEYSRIVDSFAQDIDLDAVGKVSKKAIEREITYEQLKDIVESDEVTDAFAKLDSHDRAANSLFDKFYKFYNSWGESSAGAPIAVNELMRQLDRFERAAHLSYILNWDVASETAALRVHAISEPFNKIRRRIKRLDTISLKDARYITFMHTSRMAAHLMYRDNAYVTAMYDGFISQVVDPILDSVQHLTTEEASLVDSDIIAKLQSIKSMANGYTLTNNLIDDLGGMQGFTEDKINTLLTELANNFGYYGDLSDLVANPDFFRRKLTEALRKHTGAPSLSIDSMADDLRLLGTSNVPKGFENYSKEIQNKPELKGRLNRVVNKLAADPTAKVEEQMLYAALLDPVSVRKWDDAVNNGQPVIFCDMKATGLNTELNSLSSISVRHWVPVNLAEDETLTLERLLDAFEQGETKVFQRRMNDAELDEVTENMLRRMDMKGATRAQMLEQYKKLYGASDEFPYRSEEDMLREVCQFFKDSSYKTYMEGVEQVTPSLVFHDMDGFNLSYFNYKVKGIRGNLDDADPISNYVDRLAYGIRENYSNTYNDLADAAEDLNFTEDQIDELTKRLQTYASQLGQYGSEYHFGDTYSYSRLVNDLINSIESKSSVNKANDMEMRFLNAFQNFAKDDLLDNFLGATRDMQQLMQKPKGFAFVSDVDNASAIHAAIRDKGFDTIDIESRARVDDVLTYFKVDMEDGFCINIGDLKKMSDLSNYIIRRRDRQMAAGAEEYLSQFKPRLDNMIQTMIDVARNEAWDSTELAYIADLKIPDTAVETYLMARKLYNDHMRYWIDDNLAGEISERGRALDSFKLNIKAEVDALAYDDPMREYLNGQKFEQVIDYVNNFRRRFFDQIVGGGFDVQEAHDMFDLFESQSEAREAFWEETKAKGKAIWDEAFEKATGLERQEGQGRKEAWNIVKQRATERRKSQVDPIFNGFKERSAARRAEAEATVKSVWTANKEFNELLSSRLSPKWEAQKAKYTERELERAEMNALNAADWRRYNVLKDVTDEWYDVIKYVDDDDPLLEVYRNQRNQMREIKAGIKERKNAFQEKWFLKVEYKPTKTGKPRSRIKSKIAIEGQELKRESKELRSREHQLGWGRKTTEKQIRRSVRDTFSGLHVDGHNINDIIDNLNETAKQASRLKHEGKYYEAGQRIYDDVVSFLDNAYRVDTTEYEAMEPLRRFLRENAVNPASVRDDIADFNQFRKKRFGRLKFRNDGRSYDEIVDELLADDSPFRDYFKDMDGGASGFYKRIDELFESHKPQRVSLPDDEKQYLIDELVDSIDSILESRPNYSISEVDDEFVARYNQLRKQVMDYKDAKAFSEEQREAAKAVNQADYEETMASVRDVSQSVVEANNADYTNIIQAYEAAEMDSMLHTAETYFDYDDLRLKQLHETYDAVDTVESKLDQESEDFFELMDNPDNPRIFKRASRELYSNKIAKVEDGRLKEKLDVARKCADARDQIGSKLQELGRIDQFSETHGTSRADQILMGATFRKAQQLFDVLRETGLSQRSSCQKIMEKFSEFRQLQIQYARIDALKDADGFFSRDAMLQELVYNGFNMTVFNSHCYSSKEMRELRDAVIQWQSRGDDIFGYFEDNRTGNVFVYLKDSVQIGDTRDARWINNTIRIDKPAVKPHIAFAEFDELLPYLDDIPDAEDYRGVYNHMLSCWDDTRMLSLGAINGTSGRTVSLRQAEEFIKTLPNELSDWCTSEALLKSELARDVIYDPGFVRSDTPDMLFDFVDTINRQAAVAREDTLLASAIINKNDNLPFNELAQYFTDEQLIQYFGENPDYVVCTLLPKRGTATGFEVRQLKLTSQASLDAARAYENVTVMPYDVYFEIADIMNRTPYDSNYRRLLSKYMLVYKAFALVRPGTWVRNYIDATTKASIESGGGLTEGAMMLQYEARAVRGIGLATKLAKVDPSFLNEANWDVIQRTFGTDLTYEDFEVLRGVVDAERFTPADRRLINRTAERRAGQNIISGENIGIRNLDEKDITTAFKKYLDGETNFKKDEFLDIYFNGTKDPELARQFEDAMLKLSNNLRKADMSTILDKSVRIMFKPFGTVEQVVRYAQTMYLKDMGLSQNQITKKLHASQFYNAPSWGPWSKLETIMPFITFRYNNIMFWIRMMDENPRYFRYFEDIYGNIAEDTLESMEQQGQDIDYENDYALQSGAVPIGCGKYYFNLGNSFLSAMNDFYDLPFQFNSLNPLLRDSVKLSLYALGFNSKEFFSNIDLDITDDDPGKKLRDLIPGGDLTYKTYKLFKDVGKYCSETNGPSMDALMAFCKYASLVGSRNIYARNGSFDFEQWQEELAEQGKWYDANIGRVVSLSEKNELGANNPESSFEDIQAYQLLHFGKIWDANQRKFVLPEDYIEGGYNNGFDWDNDPEGAWEALQAYMLKQGKVYDYNQRKFVYEHQYIEGGLNDPDITFAKKQQLMEEKFGLYWDGNRCAWVEKDRIIPGGLNDTKNFREVMSLRLAMFGETYDRVTHKFNKTTDPKVVVVQNLEDKRFNNYYSRLGIPSLTFVSQGININSEGLLVTNDGKYIITGNPEHDNRIFEKFKHTFGGRGYRGWKRYSHWRNFNWSKKPYKGRTLPQHYYTGYGWNDEEGYYRFNYSYNYQYHNPQPGRKLHRLLSPRIQYPYGGGYNKYSFYTR